MNSFKIVKLSLEEKIGQLLMPRLDFNHPDALTYAKVLIERNHVGSFIVMGGEVSNVRHSIKELQNASRIPLLFGCDAERGLGQILSGGTLFPSTMSLGATGDYDLAYRQARVIAKEMRDCCLNVNFAPIVDVNSNPENPIINVRSYGDDPHSVSNFGVAFIRGCHREGMMACAKHFPGHGATGIDSHIDLPTLGHSLDHLLKCDLIPFQKSIESGVSSIMAAHLATPEIDLACVPATISAQVINKLLKRDLGFRGLVYTDSFHMGAIDRFGNEDDLASEALKAGCDIILDPRDPNKLTEKLIERTKAGIIPGELLDRSIEKIMAAKKRLTIMSDVLDSDGRKSAYDLRDEISTRSVCLLKGEKLFSSQARVIVLDITQAESDISKPFVDKLVEGGISCYKEEILPLDHKFPIQADMDSNQCVICLVYSSVGAWRECYKLPETFKTFLKEVCKIKGTKILISFGSPYVVQKFDDFSTIIAAFDHLDASQKAVAEVLLGELEPKGRMPVKLDLEV